MVVSNEKLSEIIKNKILYCLRDNVDFSLPLSEIKELFESDICPYSGQRIDQVGKTARAGTFERINPFKGYVSGNVVIVTKAANQEKAKLDAFVKNNVISFEMKIKLLRKAIYALQKNKEGSK